MPRPIPPPFGLTLTILRMTRGWTQGELAREAATSQVMLSDYEVGKRQMSREKLDSLARVLGFPTETVEAVLALAVWLLNPASSPSAPGLSPEDHKLVTQAAAMVGRVAFEAACEDLTRALQAARAESARREARESWGRLKTFSPGDRRVLVDGALEYQTWALCELVCWESERAAASDPRHSIELAELALRISNRVAGDESLRSQIQAYAFAHRGNARRAADDFEGAEADFRRAWELRKSARAGNPGRLDQGLALDLEASLRKDQRRFEEAVALHEQAVAAAGPERLGDILLNFASTLEQMGEVSRSVEMLERAAPHVDAQRSPRSLLGLRFNLATNLLHLNRVSEAAALLPVVREMAVQLRNELDLLRVRWLESRILAGQSRRAEAAEALSEVGAGFLARKLGYDAALASLELAVLYLEEDRTGEVKALARGMAPIFRAQGVHREALAALQLFCDAAEREAVTLELARRLVHYLERARLDPDLRFAG
jgi:tetratricopeptide (TPR) repeat protein